jgi:predicted RNA-binding Zn-ribbon protein involved in translation (DUF1610 family)
MRITIKCPHCNSRAITRSAREMSITLREIVYMCLNPECGHTYVANLEVVRTLSLSAKPRQEVRLPISPHVRQRVMEQLDLLD